MNSQTSKQPDNVDPTEINKFSELASRWWDPESEFKPLHQINPLRLDFIQQRTPLEGLSVLDVGCGGGILCESMAALGASVSGIDMAEAGLNVAKMHGIESGISVEYQQITAEKLANEQPGQYDVVTCLEMLEHVPNPSSIVNACSQLAKPSGAIYFSTLNRTPKSFAFAIVGAEYVLQLLPKGTHQYEKFIKPSELNRWAELEGLQLKEMIGMHYNPLFKSYSLGKGLDVNYLAYYRKTNG